MAPLTGENSSYTLVFEGPRVQCHDGKALRTADAPSGRLDLVVSNGTWFAHDPQGSPPILELTSTNAVGYFPAPRKPNEECRECYGVDCCSDTVWPPLNTTVTALIEDWTMQCDASTVTYQVEVKYERGIQHVTYTTAAEKMLHLNQSKIFQARADGGEIARSPAWYHQVNIRALLDSVGQNLQHQWDVHVGRAKGVSTVGTHKIPNGTEIELGKLFVYNNMRNSKMTPDLTCALLTSRLYRLYYAPRHYFKYPSLWAEWVLQI